MFIQTSITVKNSFDGKMTLVRREELFLLLIPQNKWMGNKNLQLAYFHVANKKVLLRERKRHTDCGVSSTTRGGVLSRWGAPPARSDGGTQGGVPPIRVPSSQILQGKGI